jgi:hypothetical protein
MATTARQLIDAAYGHSKLNQPEVSANETGELLPLIQRRLRTYFAEATRANRKVFGTTAETSYSGGSWARPAGAEMIVRIEAGTGGLTKVGGGAIAAGTEIIEVPVDQRNIEPGKPCIYAWGQKYFSVATTNDPTGAGALKFFYSKRADDIATLTTSLDALWPEQFNDLLILDVARYLARKDGGERRTSEMATLTAEHDAVRALWLAWLGHESLTEVRDYDHYTIRNNQGARTG